LAELGEELFIPARRIKKENNWIKQYNGAKRKLAPKNKKDTQLNGAKKLKTFN